ncbi:MAG: ankyrin repeat domain-containing protein [Bacteroidetes bacterium]|nr:ankyrin repeat domain-containing protein [Bacteroidota bacterium]
MSGFVPQPDLLAGSRSLVEAVKIQMRGFAIGPTPNSRRMANEWNQTFQEVKMRKFYGLMIISLGFILCSCGGLLYNAQIGDVEKIEKALERGTSIEEKNEFGSTALIIAAFSGKADAVEYLCKKGANVNARNDNGVTGLIHAAYYNLYDVVKILVKYDADKTIKDKYGNTALNYAEQNNNMRMISLLKNE